MCALKCSSLCKKMDAIEAILTLSEGQKLTVSVVNRKDFVRIALYWIARY